MKLRWKLILICLLLTAGAVIFAVSFAVSFAWQDATRRQAADLIGQLQTVGAAIETNADLTVPLEGLPGTNRLLFAFQRATRGSSDYVLMSGSSYLVNNTGLALGDLLDRMTPAAGQQHMSWGAFNVDGQSFLAAAWTPRYLPVSVFAVESLRPVNAAISALACRCTVLSGAVILAAWLLASSLTSRALRPLTRLEDAAVRIAQDHFPQTLEVHGHDEVAALTASFNYMSSAIQANVRALQETADRQQQFIGDLGHELKTPVTAILLNAETLLTRKMPEENRLLCTQRIQSQARWLEHLSQQLLEIVLLNAPAAIESIDAQQFIAMLRDTFEERLAQQDLRLQTAADVHTISADRNLLLSAVSNLIVNAAKASRPGDTVDIRIHESSIEVRDSGTGMSAAVLARAREPFFVGDGSRSKKHGGAGLGLALVQRICEAHGGRLDLESSPGSGTVACIHLRTGSSA